MDTADILSSIDARGLHNDALRAVETGDWPGLAYIVNMAQGLPGDAPVTLGQLFPVIDAFHGVTA